MSCVTISYYICTHIILQNQFDQCFNQLHLWFIVSQTSMFLLLDPIFVIRACKFDTVDSVKET